MTALEDIVCELQEKLRRKSVKPPTETEQWWNDMLAVFAKAYCLADDRTHKNIRCLLPFIPERWRSRLLPSIAMLENRGGVKAVWNRIRKGGLEIDDQLSPWTGGFWHGLQMARALRPPMDGSHRWQIWERTHRELLADLEQVPFPIRLESRAGRNGVRRLSRCLSSYLPPSDPLGADVVAGLFTGGVLHEIDGEQWVALPASPSAQEILAAWSIRSTPMTFRRRDWIRISPFYAALFADLMPPRSASRILGLRRAAQCPILPAIYWDHAMRQVGMPVLPFGTALPFGCSLRTFRRRGWQRGELHRMGLEFGITHVDRRLRIVIRKWFERALHQRGT